MEDITINLVSASDANPIYEFMQNHFRIQEPITHSLNGTTEDTADFYKDIVHAAFKTQPYTSYVVKNTKDEVVGTCLSAIYRQCELSRLEFDVNMKEFSQLIDKGPYKTQNANRLAVFLDFCESGLHKRLNPEAKVFKVDILGVRTDYTRRGIASTMLNMSVDLAKEYHCTHMASCVTAQGSQSLAKRREFTTVKEVMFDDFLENGVPVYANLHDQGPSTKLVLLTL